MHDYHTLYSKEAITPCRCGFYGIYANSAGDAALYVIADQKCQNVVLIPLTTNWYWTAARMIDHVSVQKVYIAMPNMNVRMIADAFNLMLDYMGRKYIINLIYPEPVYDLMDRGDPAMASMLQMCKRTEMMRIPGMDCSIHYRSLGEAAGTGTVYYAIEVITEHGRQLFLEHINLFRGHELLQNILKSDLERPYKWVSMPWRQPVYGGYSMYDIIHGNVEYLTEDIYNVFQEFSHRLKGRLVPYRFSCTEELQEAKLNTNAGLVNVPARLVF